MATLAPHFGLVGAVLIVVGLLLATLFRRKGVAKLGGILGLFVLYVGARFAWQAAKPVAQAEVLPGDVPAVQVGDAFLDFTAQDHTGADFTLSSLTGKPILLKIFRGHW